MMHEWEDINPREEERGGGAVLQISSYRDDGMAAKIKTLQNP